MLNWLTLWALGEIDMVCSVNYLLLPGLPWVWGSPWDGYGDRNSVPTAALDSAVGMGIPMGWDGDRNSVPTAALDSAVGMGIPMGWVWG